MIVGCGLWKAIGNRWVVFKSITCFIVGNGRKINSSKTDGAVKILWKSLVLVLFSIVVDKDSWIVECGNRLGRRVGGVLCVIDGSTIGNQKK